MTEIVEQENKPTLAEFLESRLINGDDVKRKLDMNFLKLFAHRNQDVIPEELIDFLHKAQLSGADPRKNQIYLMKYFSRKDNRIVSTPVFSYHFMIDAANRTGELEGYDVESDMMDLYDFQEKVMKEGFASKAVVYRKGRKPTPFIAREDEYYNDKNPIWKSKGQTMLEKTAIAGALRRAFPEILSGCYMSTELEKDIYSNTEETNFEKANKITEKFLVSDDKNQE